MFDSGAMARSRFVIRTRAPGRAMCRGLFTFGSRLGGITTGYVSGTSQQTQPTSVTHRVGRTGAKLYHRVLHLTQQVHGTRMEVKCLLYVYYCLMMAKSIRLVTFEEGLL